MKTIKTLLIIAFVLLCSTVASAYDFEVDGIYYNITDATAKTVEVTYKGSYYYTYDEYSGHVVIPNKVHYYNEIYYSVTTIGDYAFAGCTGLTSITIPNSVTSIGHDAFYNCTGLTSIEIPNSVTSIGDDAFEYTGWYYNQPNGLLYLDGWLLGYKGSAPTGALTINEGAKGIAGAAFDGCTGLTSITIPNSVTSIGGRAFYDCTSLTSVSIGNSVKSIGGSAFNDCTGLTAVHISDLAAWCRIDFSSYYSNPLSYAHNLYLNGEKVTDLVIPSDITEIKQYAFDGCRGLTSVTIPNSVTSIGNYAFAYCTGITSITIPNSVTSIGNYAFYGCTGITSITIPNSVTSIGNYAFDGCTGLTSITIPNSVTTIEMHAFDGCTGLTSINIPNSVTTIEMHAFDGCTGLTSVTIPNSVTSIGSSAFYWCTGLTSVTIPNSVTTIGDHAFNGCTALRELRIEDGGSTLSLGYNSYDSSYYTGKGLFYDCPLETLYLGRNLSYDTNSSYGYSPFYGITTLKNVTIGNSVTSIGDYAFKGCTALKELHIEDGNSTLSLGYNGYDYSYNKGQGLFHNCPLETLYLGRNLSYGTSSSYGYSPFYGITTLKNVTIGNSVTSIGNYAFNGCTALKELRIEDGNSTLSLGYNSDGYSYNKGEGLFYDCPLETLYLGRNLSYNTSSSYGYSPFYGIITLKNVTIGNSVTSIGKYAFDGCTGLTAVHISDLSVWCKIDFSSYDSNPLYYAENLYLNGELVTDLVIPNNVTEIKQYAFYHYTGLTSVTIGYGVTNIEERAFYNCTGLTSVTIPNSVTSIGNYAFNGCNGLKFVYNNSSLNITKGSSENGYVACYALAVITDENRNYYDWQGDYLFSTIDGTPTLVAYIGSDTLITLPENYNGKNYAIGNYAFNGCTGITSVTIPNSVTSIEDNAFEYCTALKELHIEDGNSTLSLGYNSTWKGLLYDCPLETLYLGRNLSYDTNSSYGYSPFYGITTLKNVTIGNSVTSIGNYAFYGCTALRELRIEDGDSTLSLGYNSTGKGLLYDCPLETLYLGRNLSYNNSYDCGYSPFYKVTTLKNVTIGNGVTSIGKYAFDGCTGLTAVHISDLSVWCKIDFSSYGSNPLCYAENLYLNGEKVTDLVIPSDVTEIKNYAFSGCDWLTSIEIPNSVTSIGEWAFSYCSGLTSVTIGNSVTTIGNYAFKYCTSLTSVTIGNGVTSIGYDAFDGCYIAKTIWLTNTPPSGYSYAQGKINYVANNQYTQLSNVVVYSYLSSLFEVDGIKHVPVSPAERTCDAIDCIYDTAIETVNIGKTVLYKNIAMNVKEVMPYTCYKNKNIRNLTISNDGSIGDKAFYGCTELNEITISNKGNVGVSAFEGSATSGSAKLAISNDGSIGDKAFYGCTELNEITISNKGNVGISAFEGSATSGSAKLAISNDGSIGDKAFYGCTGLSDMTISNKGDIGESAFAGSATSGSAKLAISNDGSIGDKAFYGCIGLNDIAISNKGDIGKSAFEDCTGASVITLGNGITSIGGSAFYGCSSLEEVVIPNSVTSLNSHVFHNCSALNNVVLSKKLSTIGEYAFRGCSALPEIRIPQATTKIGNYVFTGCSSLTDVIIEDRTAALSLGSNGSSPLFADCPLDSVYIGGKICYNTGSSYGYSPFYRNSSLRSVVITDVEEKIYDNEFYGCTGLKNVQIGNSVKSIGNWAFSGCSNLDYLIVGANVSTIGQEAFSDCTNVTTIYAHALVPPVCSTQALEDINKWNCTLMVPNESIADYQTAEQWKDFFFISDIPTGITEITPDDTEPLGIGVIYDLNGRPVNEPAKGGIYIIDGKKVML